MGRCPLSCARIAAPATVIPRNPRREIVMIVFRVYFLVLQGHLLFGCQGTSARAHIVAHQARGLEHGGPVCQVRRKDLFHQLARPQGNAHVELGRRNAEFVGQRRPIQAVGFPALRHDAAGVAHQGREGAQVQKLGLVGVGQRRLGRGEGARGGGVGGGRGGRGGGGGGVASLGGRARRALTPGRGGGGAALPPPPPRGAI